MRETDRTMFGHSLVGTAEPRADASSGLDERSGIERLDSVESDSTSSDSLSIEDLIARKFLVEMSVGLGFSLRRVAPSMDRLVLTFDPDLYIFPLCLSQSQRNSDCFLFVIDDRHAPATIVCNIRYIFSLSLSLL